MSTFPKYSWQFIAYWHISRSFGCPVHLPWQWLMLWFQGCPGHQQSHRHARRLLEQHWETRIEGLFVVRLISWLGLRHNICSFGAFPKAHKLVWYLKIGQVRLKFRVWQQVGQGQDLPLLSVRVSGPISCSAMVSFVSTNLHKTLDTFDFQTKVFFSINVFTC